MIALDALLHAALLLIGLRCLAVRDLRTGAMLFIVFGLLLSLVWVRLAAPDVALAEAAIGAGVTGALLLDASAALRGARPAQGAPRDIAAELVTLALGLTFAVALAFAVWTLPGSEGAATRMVAGELAQLEVAHPVTAVLLVFRAYDTLLEIGVLLVAVIAAFALRSPERGARTTLPDPVLAQVTRVTVPVAILVAIYLLWAGAFRTGGAFQAGAVLAGALLLARFAGAGFVPADERVGDRVLLGGGFALFVLFGFAGLVAAGAVLAYPQGWGMSLILVLETALAVSIAGSLVALFGPRAPV